MNKILLSSGILAGTKGGSASSDIKFSSLTLCRLRETKKNQRYGSKPVGSMSLHYYTGTASWASL
ncbi:MAG: hypothetical protein R3C53_22880 [Pirellulaceae bacterium]